MEQKAKRKFNIVDVIILVLILAVVGFAAYSCWAPGTPVPVP